MKKIVISKRCEYTPEGGSRKVFVRPGQVLAVSDDVAEKMIAGNVAIGTEPKKTPKKTVKKK